MPTKLPTIARNADLLIGLKVWQRTLSPNLIRPRSFRPPFNFRASTPTATGTGITLDWSTVRGADGYEIQRSSNGDFSTGYTIIVIYSGRQESHFDSLGATGTQRWYRIRATGGNALAKHSIKGAWSSVIKATSNDGTTTYDGTTDDAWSEGSGDRPPLEIY